MPVSPTRAGASGATKVARICSFLYILKLATFESLLQSHQSARCCSLSPFQQGTHIPIEKCLELLSSLSTFRTISPLILPLASPRRIASSKLLKRSYRRLGPSKTPMKRATVHSSYSFSTKSPRMTEPL